MPGGVLGPGDRVGRAEDVLRRVGQLLGGGPEVVPRPRAGRRGQSGGLEELLVVHHGDVVHDRREADDVAVGRRGLARGRRELRPLHRGVLDLVGDVERAPGQLHLGGPAAEVVGDVRVAAAGELGGQLGQQIVRGRRAGGDGDRDRRGRLVELRREAFEELLRGDLLAGPDRDRRRLRRVQRAGGRGGGRRAGGRGDGQGGGRRGGERGKTESGRWRRPWCHGRAFRA